ncbi:MAG: 2-phosphosulfolactate phosphatase [Acidimicrobiia bacterium]
MDQDGFAYRFDWGPSGLRSLAPVVDVLVIVDVLRFTTAVSVAVDRGSTVFPYRFADSTAGEYAAERDALLAGRRGDGSWSLSPTELLSLPEGARLVLPSPNGSALAFAARRHGAAHVLAGCLRNASATARRARALATLGSGVIGVTAAGERWRHDIGPVRHAVEDLLGAGAVLAALDPSGSVSAPRCSPEAAAARAAFLDARSLLAESLLECATGRELAERGCADDVEEAAVLDVSSTAALLVGDAFVAAG